MQCTVFGCEISQLIRIRRCCEEFRFHLCSTNAAGQIGRVILCRQNVRCCLLWWCARLGGGRSTSRSKEKKNEKSF